MKKGILYISFVFLCCCTPDVVINHEIPESRSFYMGFTAFPYDFSQEALDETYKNVGKDGDIYLTHLDSGIPWDEALNGLDFPSEITKTIQDALEAQGPNQKFLLTATPTSQTRNTLALYWNNTDQQQPLPDFWKNKKFNDPDVIKAYINYCKRIIDLASPDYFAHAIETNNSFISNSENFNAYLELAEAVYTALKAAYPGLPIMLTLQADSFEISKSDLLENSRKLLAFSDYVAISTYPYLSSANLQRDANPALFPNNWLEEFRDLAPEKPFAISETAYIAEDLALESVDIKSKGSEEWQRDYLQKLMVQANALDAEFVCWFIYRDYDELYKLVPTDIFRIWRDTGLQDGNGKKRESYELWKEWLGVERE